EAPRRSARAQKTARGRFLIAPIVESPRRAHEIGEARVAPEIAHVGGRVLLRSLLLRGAFVRIGRAGTISPRAGDREHDREDRREGAHALGVTCARPCVHRWRSAPGSATMGAVKYPIVCALAFLALACGEDPAD